jgi:hypothetical protein
MSDYSSSQGADFAASVETKQASPVGNMVRKTLYRVEAFPPLDIPSVKWILGGLYNEVEREIQDILVQRGGDQMVPVGELVKLLGDKATRSMKELLFSRPLWVEEAPNLVVMAGLTDSLNKHFLASAYTAAWYVGIVSGTPTFAEGNTMASHAGWFEIAPYAGARPTLTLGTVVSGSVDNSSSRASYTITAATMVVGGAFLVTLPTASQTSGTLYGGAAFTGGNRTVASGDTLNVTTTLSATAS